MKNVCLRVLFYLGRRILYTGTVYTVHSKEQQGLSSQKQPPSEQAFLKDSSIFAAATRVRSEPCASPTRLFHDLLVVSLFFSFLFVTPLHWHPGLKRNFILSVSLKWAQSAQRRHWELWAWCTWLSGRGELPFSKKGNEIFQQFSSCQASNQCFFFHQIQYQ